MDMVFWCSKQKLLVSPVFCLSAETNTVRHHDIISSFSECLSKDKVAIAIVYLSKLTCKLFVERMLFNNFPSLKKKINST